MKIKLNLLLLFIAIQSISTFCKYEQKVSYTFQAVSRPDETVYRLYKSHLSPDGKQLMVTSRNQDTRKFEQQVFDFNGTKICTKELEQRFKIQGWPPKTKGLYFNDDMVLDSVTMYKAVNICQTPTLLSNLSSPIHSSTYRDNNGQVSISFIAGDRQIRQYNITTGKIQRKFELKSDEISYKIHYPKGNKYLYVETGLINPYKIIIFDVHTLQRLTQITSDINMWQGVSDGSGYLGYNLSSMETYFIDKNGNVSYLQKVGTSQLYFTNCGQLIVTISNQSPVTLTFLNPINGNVQQKFNVDFSPYLGLSDCNEKYLSLIDYSGMAHIFKAEDVDPQPKPDPKPDPTPDPTPDSDNTDNSLPIWAIILIIVGGVLIIGVAIKIVMNRRKQRLSEYSSFSNQKSMPILD